MRRFITFILLFSIALPAQQVLVPPNNNGTSINPASINGVAYCDGTKNASLNAAVAAASNPGGVVIPLGVNCPVTSNLTVPTGIVLTFQSSSQLNVPNSTLTINGPINASINQRIFSFTGSGNVALGGLAAQNVSPMWFGAVGDCSTDDSVAFQAAATASGSSASILVPTPPTCFLLAASGTKVLSFDSTNDITVKGASEEIGISGNTGRPLIIFTGNPTTSYISAQSSNRFTLKSLKIQYNNSIFTGKVVDFTNGSNPTLDHVYVTGSSPAVNAAKLVDFTGVSDGIRILYSSFGNAVTCVDLGGSSAPVITGSDFGSTSAPCSTVALTGLGQGAATTGITFEMLTDTGTQTALDGSTSGVGVLIGGSWFGDMATGYTGPLIKFGSGAIMVGNRIQGISTATAIQINGSQQSFVFLANFVSGFGTVFSCNGPLSQVLIAGNTWSSVTTFNGGTGPCFAGGTTQGIVIDNNNKTSYFGTGTNDSATAGAIGELSPPAQVVKGSAVSLTTNTTANVTSASLTAGNWSCYGAVDFTFGATTSVTNLAGGISTTSATLGAQDSGFDSAVAAMVPTTANDSTFPLPTVNFKLASTTTVFLVARATFTLSTTSAYGTLQCIRAR